PRCLPCRGREAPRALRRPAGPGRRRGIRGGGARAAVASDPDLTPHERSVAFDRAAPFYDHTRQLSSDAAKRVVEMLTDELRGRGRALEIGVGTGRIALPVAEAGIPVTGVDLSGP